MIIVSGCLAGLRCRFDGRENPVQKIIDLVKEGKAIPLCSEQLGGLATPRAKAERVGEKVLTEDGVDITSQFKRGADEVLKIAKIVGCKKAILKSKSPSCGSCEIFDGTFSKTLIKGNGVLAELLKENNIEVVTENEI